MRMGVIVSAAQWRRIEVKAGVKAVLCSDGMYVRMLLEYSEPRCCDECVNSLIAA